jgi:hypothetical protein
VLRPYAQGAPAADVLSLAERTLEHVDVVPVAAGLDRRFTTRELLGAEQRIVAYAERGRGQEAGVLTARHADVELRGLDRPLSDEQERVVRAIVSAGHRIDTVEALAGTGKTTSAGALRELYEQAGYRMVGAAPTGRGVRELEERAGIGQSLTLENQKSLEIRGPATSVHPLRRVVVPAVVGSNPIAHLRKHAC